MSAGDVAAARLEEVQARAAVGEVADPRLAGDLALTRLLTVATAAGSPVLPALEAADQAWRDRSEITNGVRVATAQARAVALGLLALPVLLVPGLAGLLDLDLVAFYSTPAGTAVALAAGALIAIGALTVRLLVGRATRRGVPPADGAATDDEVIDLIATGCGGATSIGDACRLAAEQPGTPHEVLQRLALALELGRSIDLPAPFDRVHRTLERSGRLGAPVEPALRRLASSARAERRTRALESAQRLPALLAFPTALCLLPASVLLVGAPLVASGLAGAAGTP